MKGPSLSKKGSALKKSASEGSIRKEVTISGVKINNKGTYNGKLYVKNTNRYYTNLRIDSKGKIHGTLMPGNIQNKDIKGLNLLEKR